MRTPESYLNEIEKLRTKHTANFEAERWQANDTLQRKIITAWEGYHRAVSNQLDRAGVAVGNETLDYTVSERIKHLANARDYFMRQTESNPTKGTK